MNIRTKVMRVLFSRLLCVFLLVSACVAPVWCAPGNNSETKGPPALQDTGEDQLWRFTTEEQLRAAILKYIKNPRALYYIILRAHERNLAGQASVIFHDLLLPKPQDHPEHAHDENPKAHAAALIKGLDLAHVQSAYAYSHFMATGPLSREYFVRDVSPLVKALRMQEPDVAMYRKESLKAAPKSPEVLLETAIPLFYKGADTKQKAIEQCQKACESLREATQLAPQWADTHYWLAQLLIELAPVVPEKIVLAKEALAAYQKAEDLDPKLHPQCVYGYVYAYQALGQPDKVLEYLDQYIQIRPDFGKQSHIVKWREALLKQLQAKQS